MRVDVAAGAAQRVLAAVQAPVGPSAAQTAALDKEAADRLAERLQGSLGKPLQQGIRQVWHLGSGTDCI